MQQEYFLTESPKEKSDIGDEAIFKFVFPARVETIENLEDIDSDRLYFLTDSIPQKSSTENESINKEETPNELVLLDDYEAAFNKLGQNNNFNSFNYINYVQTNFDSDNNVAPSFMKNILKENNCFSPVENEKKEVIIKIEEPSKKEKYTNKNIEKSKKKKKEKKKTEQDYKNSQQTKKVKRGPYKKKSKIIQETNTEDKCFPFTTGKGEIISGIHQDLIISVENSNLEMESESLESNTEFNNNKEIQEGDVEKNANNITTNDLGIWKFTTKKYFIASNGKKKMIKKKRKFKPDDIRKKIKARFHKSIKNIINENLKKAGAKVLFDFIPQSFIGNVSKKINNSVLNYTYKDILSNSFSELIKSDSVKVDSIKFERNKSVLKYLEENPKISKLSGFDIVKNMKYKDLLRIYFLSSQFENSVVQLKNENESYEYIQEYIYRAKTYLRFFSNYKNNADDRSNKTFTQEEN